MNPSETRTAVETSKFRLPRIVATAATVLFAMACAGDSVDDEGRLRVVTTTGIIGDVARQIGGEHVSVTSLMGPGVDPHLYKASAGDVTTLSRARLILYNGLHLEAKMGDVLEQMRGRVTTVAVASGVDQSRLLSPAEFAGAYDPHIWFDVSLWSGAVERVRDALVDADSANADAYRSNAQRYLAELAQLHQYVLQQARTVPVEQRVLVTAHDAFNYFGRAYEFEVRGLQGISTASEAGTADVQALSDFIVSRGIPAIFVESSVSPRTIEAVRAAVQAKGGRVSIGGELFSDALGTPGTSADNYVGMVRHNVDVIVRALTVAP